MEKNNLIEGFFYWICFFSFTTKMIYTRRNKKLNKIYSIFEIDLMK